MTTSLTKNLHPPNQKILSANYETRQVFRAFDQVCSTCWNREIPTQKPRAIWLFLHEPLELMQVQKC